MNVDIEKEISNEIKKFNGLLDHETAKILVMERKGLLDLPKISDAKGNASLYAKILSMGKIRNAGNKKVLNIVIGDETECCILTLWEENAEEGKNLNEGDSIKIINGYVKKGYYGKEINVGKWGKIKKVEKEIKVKECGQNFLNLIGVLNKKYPTEVYINGNEEKFFSKIDVDGKEIILLNERIKDVQKFKEGDKISIKWAYSKNKKIYLNDFGKIEKNN